MPNDPKPKSHRRLPRRTFDIVPAGQTTPPSTSRPVVVSNKPQHSDNTLTKSPKALMDHRMPKALPAGKVDQPVPPVPDVTAPPTHLTTPPTPTPPAAPSPLPASVPAQPSVQQAAETPPDADELDLANLPGLHGLETPKPAQTAAGAPATDPADTPTGVNQTPQQAMEMAAALRELKRHPAPPPSDQPVVVVHKHDYLHTLGMFMLFMVFGVVVAAIAFNLLLDAGILNLPLEAVTNFFQ